MNDTDKIFNELKSFPQTEAIALGGSRATGLNDKSSDYDVYVYVSEDIPEAARRELLSRYCRVTEIGNRYWETEDNCTLNDGVDIDIIYRSLDDFAEGISAVVDRCEATNGYTTCMWHNLLNCKIIFDRNGRLEKLRERYDIPYPEALRKNIIERNMKLLSGALPSYDMQIKKAVGRGDLVSINHRTTEFLASYFNVIFAANRLTHPGEKRLVGICEAECKLLPDNFRENLDRLFAELYTEKTVGNVARIVRELASALEKEI